MLAGFIAGVGAARTGRPTISRCRCETAGSANRVAGRHGSSHGVRVHVQEGTSEARARPTDAAARRRPTDRPAERVTTGLDLGRAR